MRLKTAPALLLAALLIVLASCGSDSLLLSMGRDTSDLQINSLADGQVVSASSPLALELTSRSGEAQKDLEMEVSLSSPEGRSVWKSQRIASPVLNEELSLELPDLPTGQYLLEITVFAGGEQIRRKSSTFFIAGEAYAITGIKSFPPVITSDSTVLMRAELAIPKTADAYLRWSWKGKVFAHGLVSAGTTEALWTAPAEEGVYSIHLELFPTPPPAGSDFPFSSSILLSTDLYVTSGARPASGDLSPAESYLSLLHLQGSLKDAGAAVGRPDHGDALFVGSPQIVRINDSFGYSLDGKTGISIPWFVLPVEAGALKPFTISIGLTPGGPEAGGRLLTVTTVDSGFSLVVTVDLATRAPRAILAAAGQPEFTVPWEGSSGLPADRRSLLSLSILPRGGLLEAAWFLDGVPVARVAAEASFAGMKTEGGTVIGGAGGFVGIVDEFGVYIRDDQGRASTDPDLFARAALESHGDALMLAEGFDGPFLPKGFAPTGAHVASGTLVVPAGAEVGLPPVVMTADEIGFQIALGPHSATTALLQLAWEGDASPALEVPLTAESGTLAFAIAGGATAVLLPASGRDKSVKIPPAVDRGAALVARLAEPKDAGSALVMESLIVARAKP